MPAVDGFPLAAWLGRRIRLGPGRARLVDVLFAPDTWLVSGWLVETAGRFRGDVRTVAPDQCELSGGGPAWRDSPEPPPPVRYAPRVLQVPPAACALWAPAFGIAIVAPDHRRRALTLFGRALARADGSGAVRVADLQLLPGPWRVGAFVGAAPDGTRAVVPAEEVAVAADGTTLRRAVAAPGA